MMGRGSWGIRLKKSKWMRTLVLTGKDGAQEPGRPGSRYWRVT